MATVIVKVTEKCNSKCLYCDVVRKKNSGTTMPLEVFDIVLTRVDEYLRQRPDERVEVLWHGGEPLLVGAEYLSAVAELMARRCAGTRERVHHSMQSNLTLLTEQHLAPLRALGVNALGTSYDPQPHVRGAGELPDSDQYNARFMQAISLLDRHGFGWGIIYVVTRRSLSKPRAIFDFLTNLSMKGGINFHPVLIYDQERKDLAVTADEFVDFLGQIFPTWWERRGRYPRIEPFASLVENVIHGSQMLGCVDSGQCTFGHVNVLPDGRTSQCGRAADWELLQYGNIADRSLGEILHDTKRLALRDRQALLPNTDCHGCRFWGLCHGGCPLDAWSKHGAFGHKTEWCEAHRGFLERHFEPITGVKYQGASAHQERGARP